MVIGDDSYSGNGPNAHNSERFVYMAFYKNGGGTSGTMDLVAINRTGSFTNHYVIASGLSLKQWYTIKVVVNVLAGTYDVYVDGVFKAKVTSRNAKTSVTHISFAQWNDGAGAFYVDNVLAVSGADILGNYDNTLPLSNSSTEQLSQTTSIASLQASTLQAIPLLICAIALRKPKRKRK
ncbi:MAG: hypothetical protein QHH24_05050 [Candidatus Bathyarchaeota archaeon]|nr:hypothetical protein [Candidatus Bathyarchaeota archaeon]